PRRRRRPSRDPARGRRRRPGPHYGGHFAAQPAVGSGKGIPDHSSASDQRRAPNSGDALEATGETRSGAPRSPSTRVGPKKSPEEASGSIAARTTGHAPRSLPCPTG